MGLWVKKPTWAASAVVRARRGGVRAQLQPAGRLHTVTQRGAELRGKPSGGQRAGKART